MFFVGVEKDGEIDNNYFEAPPLLERSPITIYEKLDFHLREYLHPGQETVAATEHRGS